MYPAQVWCQAVGASAQPVEDGHPGWYPPDPSRFRPIVNDHPHNKHDRKPFGGLWTSSYHPLLLCEWAVWAGANMEQDWVKAWVLVPEPGVRLYEIDSYADLEQLISEYPWHCNCSICQGIDMFTDGVYGGPMSATFRAPFDAEKMAADGWDGIHLTRNGQAETRISGIPYSVGHNFYRTMVANLDGWDCECTLWFRWRFREVRYHGYWQHRDRTSDLIGHLADTMEADGEDPEKVAILRKLAASIVDGH